MIIWIDADACPVLIKEMLFRAAQKRKIMAHLVANQYIKTPPSAFLKSIQVEAGFDVADAYIVTHVQAGDLVITADIPLAALVIAKQAIALNPRGTLYTTQSIQEHLSRRDLMEQLRSSGMISGGPAPMAKTDLQAFANQLDKYLTRHCPVER